MRISSLVGENEKVQQELDSVLTAHSKIKALIIEQNGEIAFQKGRNLELERLAKETGEIRLGERRQERVTEEEAEIEEQKPSYALVVSSGTMEKKEVAKLIKTQVDLTRLEIKGATMRPGREGVVITTTSSEDVGKLQEQLKKKPALQNLQVKTPRDYVYPIKVVGIDEDTDIGSLKETIVQQNSLSCDSTDLKLLKSWNGRQGITAVLGLEKNALQAIKDRKYLNIGWNRCPVYDHFFLPWTWQREVVEHGHSAGVCEGPNRCINCGREGHRKEQCRSAPSCRVCKQEDTTADADHPMMSWDCPVYKERIETERSRVLARLK